MRSKKKEDTILHALRHGCDDVENDVTRRTYARGARFFAEYLRGEGINKLSKLAHGEDMGRLQDFANRLALEGRRPSTIHTYVAGAAHALGAVRGERYSIAGIAKPKRGESVRSRDPARNRQGKAETLDARNDRLVSFARSVGLRRDEYRKLDGRSYRQDESGYMCVWVRGKGGKLQAQRILPWEAPSVAAVMAQADGKEKVFSPAELRNKIDLHGIRREIAQRAYDYYRDRLAADPQYRVQLRRELLARYDALHPHGRPAADGKARQAFEESLRTRLYVCRGEYARMLEWRNRPPYFDRLAVMAVSVFHLSHWRADVTVKNYLV